MRLGAEMITVMRFKQWEANYSMNLPLTYYSTICVVQSCVYTGNRLFIRCGKLITSY